MDTIILPMPICSVIIIRHLILWFTEVGRMQLILFTISKFNVLEDVLSV